VTRAVIPISLTLLALSVMGCGTFYNMDGRVQMNSPPTPARALRVYGGVRRDAEWLTTTYEYQFLPGQAIDSVKVLGYGADACLTSVDLALSAVGDTLTLPLTIPAALERKHGAKGAEAIADPDADAAKDKLPTGTGCSIWTTLTGAPTQQLAP
jgi:hypothetical protein